MIFTRLLLLAATVAGLEVAIEEYYGSIILQQGNHHRFRLYIRTILQQFQILKLSVWTLSFVYISMEVFPFIIIIIITIFIIIIIILTRNKANSGMHSRRPRPCWCNPLENWGQVNLTKLRQ